jgi:hypothetical protein
MHVSYCMQAFFFNVCHLLIMLDIRSGSLVRYLSIYTGPLAQQSIESLQDTVVPHMVCLVLAPLRAPPLRGHFVICNLFASDIIHELVSTAYDLVRSCDC